MNFVVFDEYEVVTVGTDCQNGVLLKLFYWLLDELWHAKNVQGVIFSLDRCELFAADDLVTADVLQALYRERCL